MTGFLGRWRAETKYDHHPWVAELYINRYGELARKYLRGDRDWSRMNRRRTRGIWTYWTLPQGKYYEAAEPLSKGIGTHHTFFYINAEGDVCTCTREEVIKWLTGS